MIKIRKATRDNLKDFNIIRGQKLPQLHKKRLNQQDKGECIYYIFFNNKKPIGHVKLNLKSKRKYHIYPLIQDLYVKDSERQKGFATKMLNLIGKALKKEGYKSMCLDVETKEKWIKAFYEKLGFKLHSGPYRQSWIEKDNNNKKINVTVIHLRKKL